jgi:hypothetical protein
MHFHLGWLGPAEGFGYGGYYTGDGRYRYVSHQQDNRTTVQENQAFHNGKLNSPVSLKVATVPSHQHE